MSTKYPGGLITKNPVTPAGPYETGAAPGVWTVEQALQYTKQGIWPTAGNVDPSAFIENLFSTYLYTGNSSTQTITNGINLSTYGGLVWTKSRDDSGLYHVLSDSASGPNNLLRSNSAAAAFTYTSAGWTVPVFNSNGYTTSDSGYVSQNAGGFNKFVSWAFRKQPKFFDVVTYTGNGVAGRTVSHNLGSVPGFFVIKRTDASGDWRAYHQSLGANKFIYLNANLPAYTDTDIWNNTAPTSTVFTLGNLNSQNINGATYVAYLFASNAGGFGLSGSDNVISCGSFVASAGQTTVTLGYEPQWILIKESSASGDNWKIWDTMRGWSQTTYSELYPNTSAAQAAGSGTYTYPTATGFVSEAGWLTSGSTYIYIAIRRGPMATPTVGTSVFTPVQNSNFTAGVVIAGQPTVDMVFNRQKDASNYTRLFDRLRGSSGSTNPVLYTNTTDAETNTAIWALDQQNGVRITQTVGTYNYVNYLFSRAPSFFDEVCYTGTGSNTTQTHNLGVVPELMILKPRSNGSNGWCVYSATVGNTGRLLLDTSDAAITGYSVFWNNTTPTSTVFSLGTAALTNESATTFVAYLFATCAGVSKVGSYTGTGTTKQIDCGFTGGARFVLIKRTDSTGDWYYWDSSRGIVAGNDPYLLINSFSAEVTNTDYVDTYSAGFEISSTAPAAINANGGTFIFLAIA